MKITTLTLTLLFALPAAAQHLIPQPTFDAIANEFSGEAAQENDRQIIQYHRIQGSPMMASVAKDVVLLKLRAWGIESSIEQFPSDGKTRYQTFISPMGWDMRGGELWVESAGKDSSFVPFRLCRFSDVPMCVSTYSKGGDWSGELVEVGAGTSAKDYEGADRDVRGKVALAYGYAENVVREAIQHGAIGVVIYPAPGDRPDHPDMVRYNGIWPRAEELDKTVGGFQISANQYTQLRGLMRQGPVRVHGKIDATLGPGQLTVVHAWIRGNKNPEEEVLITGHLDHPKWSANDNASGSAAMLEMARTLHTLIASGKLPAPGRTIHFMWVPEYFGTFAYVTKHPEARSCNSAWDDPRRSPGKPYKAGEPCIAMNLNLDMVGEDTVKTNSRFYITRTPDSVGGYLNGMMADILKQTREADLHAPAGTRNFWPAEMIPYVQGSDHDIFTGMGIAAVMLGHDPDWTHHTSEDTADKTDASEFLRVGVLAGAAAYWMATDMRKSDNNGWLRPAHLGTADIISDHTNRVAEILAGPKSPGTQQRLADNLKVIDEKFDQQQNFVDSFLDQNSSERRQLGAPSKSAAQTDASGAKGPALRRLVLIPLAPAAFELLSGDDKNWWNEQQNRFASGPGNGLASGPT
ncbi:MAG: M28 family metallopeptidase, partial [Candidatus Acidiferrales bacterium]